MSSQNHSLDAAALTPILFLVIYLYLRLTAMWIMSISNRHAERAAHQARAALPTTSSPPAQLREDQ